jgi:hypothetical protein
LGWYGLGRGLVNQGSQLLDAGGRAWWMWPSWRSHRGIPWAISWSKPFRLGAPIGTRCRGGLQESAGRAVDYLVRAGAALDRGPRREGCWPPLVPIAAWLTRRCNCWMRVTVELSDVEPF